MRAQLKDTLDYVKATGTVTKRDVAEKFEISDSGAYQRLQKLAEFGLINHAGADSWAAV